MIKIKKLTIEKFRSFTARSEFEIGNIVTLISGVNGTAKSTLLGMLCQPLGFPDQKKEKSIYTRVYDNFDLWTLKSLSGSVFKADYSDVFRISQQFDTPQSHKYTIYLEGDSIISETFPLPASNGLDVRSEGRKDQRYNGLRFVTNTTNRKPGAGNFPHPVLYLGLERLRPLSTLKKQDILSSCQLSDHEKEIWDDIYRYVMISNANETIFPKQLNTGKDFKKSYHSVTTLHFDAESASAGQDNLGQIITAIISFYRLKQTLGNSYQGGVLLIDEFDATLHPIAQQLLLEKLISYSRFLNLQIIATTHSLVILKEAFQRFRSSVSLLYLEKKGGCVKPHSNVDYDFIASDLAHVSQKAKLESHKTSVLFEDSVGASFFKQVTKGIFTTYIRTYSTESSNSDTALSNDVLKSIATRLATRKIPEFERVVYVLDPDSKSMLTSKTKRLIALPGTYFIEKEIYNFLMNLSDDDSRWGLLSTTQTQCFAGYNNIAKDPDLKNDKMRKAKYKQWFANRKSLGIFGQSCGKLFKLWVDRNKTCCREFSLQVLEALLEVKHPLIRAKELELRTKIDQKFH